MNLENYEVSRVLCWKNDEMKRHCLFSEASLSSEKPIQDRYTVRCLCHICWQVHPHPNSFPPLPFLHPRGTRFESGKTGQTPAGSAYASYQLHWPLTSSELHPDWGWPSHMRACPEVGSTVKQGQLQSRSREKNNNYCLRTSEWEHWDFSTVL